MEPYVHYRVHKSPSLVPSVPDESSLRFQPQFLRPVIQPSLYNYVLQ